MGVFFTIGEKKKRPGVYQRYENVGGASVAGATDGIVACMVRSNWGELGKVHTFESIEAAKQALGNGGDGQTVSMLTEIFAGGATRIYCVRLGSGGTKGQIKLMDNADTPKEAISMVAKSEGTRALSFMIRKVLGDAGTKEMMILEGTVELEKITFPAGGADEMDTFLERANNSKYFSFFKEAGYADAKGLAEVPQTEVPVGTDPAVTNENYSQAFTLLEPYTFNTICVDTEDVAVHTLLSAFVDRIYKNGAILPFAVVGEGTNVAFETRLSHAKAFNSYNVIYVGGGAVDTLGSKLEGHLAAARVAGMVAATASNQSLTHKVLSGMVDLTEMLTNSQYEKTIEAGMLTFSLSSGGSVWIESAVTTLHTPQGEEDEGWKKIKRTKIRKELMSRASTSVEPMIGNINNDSDGQSAVMMSITRLLGLMSTEGKLFPGGYVELDSANPPEGDSAWFNIYADDIDSMEKVYFVYKFRYSPNL